jgi:DNA-binding transcriptional LysR family regulator
MDRSAEMAAFVSVVDNGGFSPAARELELSTSALSKLVNRLEHRLGVRLLHRTTRRVQLTAEGAEFYARAQEIIASIEAAEAEVIKSGVEPRGLLRLHCGTVFSAHNLAPAIPRFLTRYPEVRIDITTDDELPRLVDSGFDLAIRVGVQNDSSHVARHICDLQRVICASPDYLEKHGEPLTYRELYAHNCLWITSLPELRRWPFETTDGLREIQVKGNVAANNAEMVLQLAIAGVGITRLTDVTVCEAVRSGELIPILTDCHHVEPIPLYAIYPSGRNLAPKVRVMVDFLVEEFGRAPWRLNRGG